MAESRSTSSPDFSPRRRKYDFSPIIRFFEQELLSLPVQNGIHARASETAHEMAEVWKEAGFTFAQMEKEFFKNPEYPLKDNDPLVLEGQDWFTRLTDFLSGSPRFNEDYDAHCLIMSTLKYFNLQHAQHPRVLARNAVFQEETRRMHEADARTLFVTLPNGLNFEIQEVYQQFPEIAVASHVGKIYDMLKLVFFTKEQRDSMECRILRKEVICMKEPFGVVPNERFKWAKELLKEKLPKVLVVNNLYVGDDEDTIRQLSEAFPDREKIMLIQNGSAANISFRSSEEATAAFWKASETKINSGIVSVFFKKKF